MNVIGTTYTALNGTARVVAIGGDAASTSRWTDRHGIGTDNSGIDSVIGMNGFGRDENEKGKQEDDDAHFDDVCVCEDDAGEKEAG